MHCYASQDTRSQWRRSAATDSMWPRSRLTMQLHRLCSRSAGTQAAAPATARGAPRPRMRPTHLHIQSPSASAVATQPPYTRTSRSQLLSTASEASNGPHAEVTSPGVNRLQKKWCLHIHETKPCTYIAWCCDHWPISSSLRSRSGPRPPPPSAYPANGGESFIVFLARFIEVDWSVFCRLRLPGAAWISARPHAAPRCARHSLPHQRRSAQAQRSAACPAVVLRAGCTACGRSRVAARTVGVSTTVGSGGRQHDRPQAGPCGR